MTYVNPGMTQDKLPEEAPDAATLYVGSDRYPYTILRKSKSGHVLYLIADRSERTDSNGLSETQEYAFFSDPNGCEIRATRRYRDGKEYYYHDGCLVRVGKRRFYSDPSF